VSSVNFIGKRHAVAHRDRTRHVPTFKMPGEITKPGNVVGGNADRISVVAHDADRPQ
jgi:hypothetical protein